MSVNAENEIGFVWAHILESPNVEPDRYKPNIPPRTSILISLMRIFVADTIWSIVSHVFIHPSSLEDRQALFGPTFGRYDTSKTTVNVGPKFRRGI